MSENLNYYWQKRNEQEQKTREREKLHSDIEQGLKFNANKAKIKALEDEVEYYKNLLTKPMREIAELNKDFEQTYDMQQEILGNWIVSQRAFREIAVKYGIKSGEAKEDIIAEGIATKEKVLNNETEYGNNFQEGEDDSWAKFYAPKIKERFLK